MDKPKTTLDIISELQDRVRALDAEKDIAERERRIMKADIAQLRRQLGAQRTAVAKNGGAS